MKKNTLFWILVCSAVSLMLGQSCMEDPQPDFSKPSVVAISYTPVSFGSVRLRCSLSNTFFKECGFYYGTKEDLSDKRTVRASVNGKTAEALLSDLEAGFYYYQVYVDGGRTVTTSDISPFIVPNVMEVDADGFDLGYAESDIQIMVETSLPLTVDLGGASWIKETKTKGLETYHKVFHISRNTEVEARSAIIRIASQNGELAREVSVRQSGGPIPIPDANFKKYLVEIFDTDQDGEIIQKEAARIKSIEVSTDTISSLQGIEFFTSLTKLSCRGSWDSTQGKYLGQLESLDVSKNTALTHLECGGNQLTVLDVSKNTALTYLYCYNNQLTALDVSKNTALTRLRCRYNPYLTEIWLKRNQTIAEFEYDKNVATIYYVD